MPNSLELQKKAGSSPVKIIYYSMYAMTLSNPCKILKASYMFELSYESPETYKEPDLDRRKEASKLGIRV